MIKVLHKAFDLLESVSANKNRVFTLTELATIIGEKPTTCANIVKTLCDRGYLARVEPRGYILGPVAQGLSFVDQVDSRLIEAARDGMSAPVKKYGATGVLAVLRRGKKKILDDYKSEGDLIINKTVRADHELYTTSTGLVLTSREKASFSAAEEKIITETYGSVYNMLVHRRKVTSEGYIALTIRPRILEVAVPIIKNGEIHAAIAVYLPEFLVSEEEKKKLIEQILSVRNEIQERI